MRPRHQNLAKFPPGGALPNDHHVLVVAGSCEELAIGGKRNRTNCSRMAEPHRPEPRDRALCQCVAVQVHAPIRGRWLSRRLLFQDSNGNDDDEGYDGQPAERHGKTPAVRGSNPMNITVFFFDLCLACTESPDIYGKSPRRGRQSRCLPSRPGGFLVARIAQDHAVVVQRVQVAFLSSVSGHVSYYLIRVCSVTEPHINQPIAGGGLARSSLLVAREPFEIGTLCHQGCPVYHPAPIADADLPDILTGTLQDRKHLSRLGAE